MKIESSIENKTCTKCKQVFPKTKEFFYTSGIYLSTNKMYLSPICKSCDKKRTREYKIKNKDKQDAWLNKHMGLEINYVYQSLTRPFKNSSINPKPKKNGWQRIGWKPEITLGEMYGELILHIQLMKDKFPETDGRLCRYCEEPWTYIRATGDRSNLKNFSIDRFDATQTYKKGNIIFCCNKCNTTKTDSLKKDWLKYLEIDKELTKEKV